MGHEQSDDGKDDQKGGTFNVLVQFSVTDHTKNPETEHDTTISGHTINRPLPNLDKNGTTQEPTNQTDNPEQPARTRNM